MRRAIPLGGIVLLLGFSGLGHVKMMLPDSLALNHFYLVLDSATYKAIEESPFLRREFAVTEQRTTTRTDITYTGVYFYGINTYFEFFDAANQSMGRLGDGGIAFGVDQPGGLDAIKKALGDQFSIAQAPITRQFGGKQVPWFYMAGFANVPMDSGLRIWAMEYHPRFLAEWNASNGKSEGVSRKQVLQRYVAVLKDKAATPYLQDVVALTIAANEATQKRFAELGKLVGYGLRVEGGTTILEGPDIELRFVPQTEQRRGIQEVTMRVARKPEQAEFQFGARSVLRFGGNGLATWSF